MRLVLAALLGLVALSPLAAALPVVNGGFDGGSAGWYFQNIDAGGGYRASGGNPDGHFILNDAGQPGSDPTLNQTLTGLVVGHTYRVSFDYMNAYPGYGSPAAISFGIFADSTVAFESSNPGTAWKHEQGSFVATAETMVLYLRGERNGDDTSYGVDNVWVDDITPSTPAPELGSLALVAAGAVLVGLVALRRR